MLEALISPVAYFIAVVILYPIGWPVVKLMTLGKYPVRGSWLADTPQSSWTRGVGIAVIMVVVMVVAHQFSPP